MKLDIVIPVYNEDENIIKLVKELEKKIVCDFRILICYDNESDSTLNYLKQSFLNKDKSIFSFSLFP